MKNDLFEVNAVDIRSTPGSTKVQFHAKDVCSIVDNSNMKPPMTTTRFDPILPPKQAMTTINFYAQTGLAKVYVTNPYGEVVGLVSGAL